MPDVSNDPLTVILFVSFLVAILGALTGLLLLQERLAEFLFKSSRWKEEREAMEARSAKKQADALQELRETIHSGFREIKEHMASKVELEAVKGRFRRHDDPVPRGFYSESGSECET